jgi:hypothetical protein
MINSIILDCGDNSLVIGRDELIEYLNSIGAEFVQIDSLDYRVDNPQRIVDELREASAALSFPFYDPSH